MAVELARLAIWVHTFVPGLPLSFLDHTLISGDSLTGIGTVEEAVDILSHRRGTEPTIFDETIIAFLSEARSSLGRLATTVQRSVGDIKAAEAAHREAVAAVEPAHQLFDLIVSHRGEGTDLPDVVTAETIAATHRRTCAGELVDELRAVHLPVAFPEIFLRDNPGFDCILGNPPWEKVKIEEHAFWGRHFPGHRALPKRDQNRNVTRYRRERPDLVVELDAEVEQTKRTRDVLHAGPHPLGSGDPDLYKAFCWRFWQLVRDDGAIGVVLPRSALAGSGTAQWRQTILDEGAFVDSTMLLNRAGWVFDDAEHRYTIGLVSIRRSRKHAGTVTTSGPFASRQRYEHARASTPLSFDVEEFRSWTGNASFPMLPTVDAGRVFRKLRESPRFDSDKHPWAFRPVREVDATNDKQHMIFDPRDTSHLWPVYKGASFDLWTPDTGEYYAWADPEHITKVLSDKRLCQQRHSRSAFSVFTTDYRPRPHDAPPKWPTHRLPRRRESY